MNDLDGEEHDAEGRCPRRCRAGVSSRTLSRRGEDLQVGHAPETASEPRHCWPHARQLQSSRAMRQAQTELRFLFREAARPALKMTRTGGPSFVHTDLRSLIQRSAKDRRRRQRLRALSILIPASRGLNTRLSARRALPGTSGRSDRPRQRSSPPGGSVSWDSSEVRALEILVFSCYRFPYPPGKIESPPLTSQLQARKRRPQDDLLVLIRRPWGQAGARSRSVPIAHDEGSFPRLIPLVDRARSGGRRRSRLPIAD